MRRGLATLTTLLFLGTATPQMSYSQEQQEIEPQNSTRPSTSIFDYCPDLESDISLGAGIRFGSENYIIFVRDVDGDGRCDQGVIYRAGLFDITSGGVTTQTISFNVVGQWKDTDGNNWPDPYELFSTVPNSLPQMPEPTEDSTPI